MIRLPGVLLPLPRALALIFAALGAIAVAVAIGVPSLWSSQAAGRLSAPPGYDDVVYLASAQRILADAGDQSVVTTLIQLVDQHAPLSTIVAVLGYVAFGGDDLGPYAANILLLAGFLFGCAVIMRELPPALTLGVLMLIGSLPLACMAVTEFRPDFYCGFLTALACVALLSERIFERRPRFLLAVGVFLGFALLSKPPAIPVTIAVTGTAYLAALGLHAWQSDRAGRWRTAARATGLLAVAAIAILVPFLILQGLETYRYIVLALVNYGSQNAYRAPWWDHLIYYSYGVAGSMIIRPALPIALILWAVTLGACLWRDRSALPRLLAMTLVTIVSYAVPTLSAVKSPYLGGAFYASLVVLMALCVAQLGRMLAPMPRTLWAILVAVVLAAGGYALVGRMQASPSAQLLVTYPADLAESYRRGTAQIWGTLRNAVRQRRQTSSGPPSWVMFISPVPTNSHAIDLFAARERVPLAGHSYYYAPSTDKIFAELLKFDYVVATASIEHVLSGPHLGDEIQAQMARRADFRLIDSFTLTPGGLVQIYERVP
jgi:hypothetical protein